MKIHLLIALILIGFSTQQCTIGCLVCNSLNQCLLCDITTNYFLNGNTCSLATQTNCLLLAQNGNCISCNAAFYLDPNSQKCLAVTTLNVVSNCGSYNSGQVCTSCNGNFFIQSGRCALVSTTISNCNFYISNGVCSGCSAGFILSNDFTSCVAIPINNNCLVYTFIGCRACNTGFVHNPNYYFVNFAVPSYVNWFLGNMIVGTSSWLQLNVCQPVSVFNCNLYAAFNICTQCNPGFFLQNGNCIAFPLPVILGCLTYSSLTVCSVCQSGMFLNQNTCINNVVITNCLTYSGAFSTTTCVQCNGGFFLQGNACVARSVSSNIVNCQIPSVTADICATCSIGFVLTSDFRACLVAISNCAQYASSTQLTSSIQCSLCNNGFYLSTSNTATLCLAGSIQFCLTYALNSNTCTVCTNGFYLSGTVCVAHIVIQNCLIYDTTRANFCSVCTNGFFNFALTTVCVQTTLRSGCLAYSVDGNTCATCMPGFFLSSGNCNLIPSTFANCNNFSGTWCTLCNSGYMVNSLPTVGTCTLPLDYIISANNSPCSVVRPLASTITPTWTNNPTGTQSPMTCMTCANYMYGYTPQSSEAICVLTSQLTLYSGFVAVVQCSRYGLNYATPQVIVCMQCNQGFFISDYKALGPLTASTSCVNSCASTITLTPSIIPDDFFGFMNICIPPTVAGYFTNSASCQRYARVTSQSINSVATGGISGDYRCVIPALTTTAIPTSYLLFPLTGMVTATTLGVAYYPFEIPSQTIPLQSSTDFSFGYSNTVDSASNLPNVFNYRGILASIADSATVIAAPPTNVNLLNCDIVVNYAANYVKTGWSFDNNSGFYTALTIGNVYNSCFRCNFGYQLSYTVAGLVGTNPAFPSCSQMNNCQSATTVYGGLPTFLNSVFSCHLCAATDGQVTYPSIYFETDAVANAGVWTGWAINGVYGSTTTISQSNHGFRCATAPTAITVTDTVATVNALSNCAAFGYITAITTTGVNVASLAVKATCLACGANFYPTYLTQTSPTNAGTTFLTTARVPNFIVASCVPSANCDTSVITQFNSCGRCRSDLENSAVPAYYAFIDFTLSNCYQVTTQNCFMVQASGFSNSATTNICSVCKAGFFRNLDNICEVYQVPNQSTSTGLFVNAYYTSSIYPNVAGAALPFIVPATTVADALIIRLTYLLSFKQSLYGVTSCSSGYTQAPATTWAPRVCVWSSYIYNNTGNFPSSSNFVNNCVRYNVTIVSGKNVCGACTSGWVPTTDGLSCVASGSLPNCAFSQTGSNSGLCYQCLPTFMNVNGVCVNSTINNCATYVNNLWSFTTPGSLQCASCINGFVLSSDFLSCSPGSVLNCIVYNQGQPTQCNTCTNGFVLLTLSTVFYCYPIPPSLNCVLLQDTSSTSGANLATISCANCVTNSLQVFGTRTWNSLGLTSQAQTLCMPFNLINNCIVYDQSNTIIRSNSFNCLQCAQGFWFSAANSTCSPRFNNPSQCTSFSNSSDTCSACSIGSFLSADGTQCINFPNGIFNCNQYSSATTCIQCRAGSFLSNNVCFSSPIINNCVVYSANFTCSACVSGFFLQNSTLCVISTAANCLTFASINGCATCPTSFGLQTTNGVASCVIVSLPNCINATVIAPFSCTVCNVGFFPGTSGVCTPIAQTIANCVIYDSATTCSRCAMNTVLNIARTVCNSTFYSGLIDSNCNQSFLVQNPTCLDCSLGFFFSNGTCVSCSNNTLAQGCLSCNPTNNNVCLICRPNFFMNSKGACIANVLPSPNPNPTPIPNNGTIAISSSIAMTVAMITLYFDRF